MGCFPRLELYILKNKKFARMNLAVRTQAKPSSSPCHVLSSRATQLTRENVWFYFEIRFALRRSRGGRGGGGHFHIIRTGLLFVPFTSLGVQPRKVHSGSFWGV